METFLIVKKKRIKKISKDEQYGRSSTDRVGCCRTRMLEAWIEEEEEDNPIKRKASQASNNVTASARPSLGGVSVGAISSPDTSVLINDSADWSPEIPFENVSPASPAISMKFHLFFLGIVSESMSTKSVSIVKGKIVE